MQGGMTLREFENRHKLLKDLDSTFASLEQESQLVEGLDDFNRKAFNMITSAKAREAFDISKETPSFAKPFGDQAFGNSCLLATRLIESGVRFVTLRLGGWDTHQSNFERLAENLLPNLDTGLSALFNGLEQKGLLDSTAVFVSGEFGRTPKLISGERNREETIIHAACSCSWRAAMSKAVRSWVRVMKLQQGRKVMGLPRMTSRPRSIAILGSTSLRNTTPIQAVPSRS